MPKINYTMTPNKRLIVASSAGKLIIAILVASTYDVFVMDNPSELSSLDEIRTIDYNPDNESVDQLIHRIVKR